MPTLGAALDLAKYEARNLRAHQLGTAPSAPVTGQLYYSTADNTLYWYDGSGWVSARGGASATPQATASSQGTIQLAGDLAGTATSPQIAAGVITDADVNAANKDGAVAIPSLRTLGAGAQQAMPGNRTLDAVTAPASDVSLNGKKLIGLADPISNTDAATKQYVDAAAQGLDVKPSVRVASVANVTVASPGTTIDGVTMVVNDRVLLKDQSTGSQNGIYVWNGAATPMTRSSDADASAEVTPGMFTFVEQGTVNADSGWVLTTDAPVVLATTALVFTQFSGAGQIIAGAGLTKTGNSLDVGAGAGITVNADTIQVANNGITNAMIADGAIDLSTPDATGTLPLAKGGTGASTAAAARAALGDAGYYSSATHSAGTTITVTQATHGLRATRGLIVQVQDEASGAVELPDVAVAANGDVTVIYGASVGANSKRLTILG